MLGYQIDDWINQPLIKYYPNIGTFSWGWVRVPAGHNTIGWYGWIAWGLIAAVVVTALYALIARSVTDRISWSWSLIVPFFFNDTATTEIYTLSLHDALPIFRLSPSVEAL